MPISPYATIPVATTASITTWADFLANVDYSTSLRTLIYLLRQAELINEIKTYYKAEYLTSYDTPFVDGSVTVNPKDILSSDIQLYREVFSRMISNSPIPNSSTTPLSTFQSLNLNNPSLITLKSDVVASLSTVRPDLLSEAVYLFSLFHMSRMSISENINGTTHFVYEFANIVNSDARPKFTFKRNSSGQLAVLDSNKYKNCFNPIARLGVNIKDDGVECIKDNIKTLLEDSSLIEYDSSLAGMSDTVKTRTCILDFLQSFNIYKDLKLTAEVNQIYRIFVPGASVIPTCTTIAAGNGSDTSAILNRSNFGVSLFQYKYQIPLTPGISIIAGNNVTLSISRNQLVHFNAFGLDKTVNTKISVQYSDILLCFDANMILPLSFSASSSKTPLATSVSDTIVSFISENYTYIYKATNPFDAIAIYDSKYRSLALFNSIGADYVGPVTIKLQPGDDGDKEECPLMINITENGGTITRTESIVLNAVDLFTNDKFEMKKTAVNSLFAGQEEYLNRLIDKLNSGYRFVDPVLQGEFVGVLVSGKLSRIDSDVVANALYKPSTGHMPREVIPSDPEFKGETVYRPLRHSYALFTFDDGRKEIHLKIVSHVSPVVSRLDSRIKEEDIYDTAGNLITDATLKDNLVAEINMDYTIGGYTVNSHQSYNQLLATLRSMGLLEGIAHQLLIKSSYNTSIKTQLASLLSAALSYDKTAEVRKLDLKYQFTKAITYSKYKQLKFYWNNTDPYSAYAESRNDYYHEF